MNEVNDVNQSQRRIQLVTLHGVGDFDEVGVRQQLNAISPMLEGAACECTLFNWDKVIGDPFARLSAIAAAVHHLPHVPLSRPAATSSPRVRALIWTHRAYLVTAVLLPALCVATGWWHALITLLAVAGLVCGASLVAYSETPLVGIRWISGVIGACATALLWPLVIVAASPWLFRIWSPLSRLAGCLTGVVISGVIGMTMAVILGGPSGLSNAFSWVMAEAMWAVIAGFAGWLVYRLIRGTAVPLVKVTSDVACWIGDARYRNELRMALAEHLALLKLGAQDHLVLFAHSLGSVVAVDYLLRGTSPIAAGRVTLVTLGSPLLRLIYRFYPNLIGHPREAASELVRNLPEFAWINIFRNYDFIGSQLQLGPPDQGSLDACTNQRYLYGLGGHVGYWSDPVVWATLGASLTGLNRRTATALSERTHMHCPAEPESETGVPFCLSTRATLAKITYAILLVTVPSVSGYRTYWRFQSADNGRQWAEANATADCTFDCKTEFNRNAIRGTTTRTSSCTAKCALTSGTEKTTAWVFKHGDVADTWQSRLRRLAAKKQSLSPEMAFLADTSAMHACGELRVVYEGSFESSSPTPISVVADPDLSRDRKSCDFPLTLAAELMLETDPRSTESRESSQAFNLFAAIGIAIISLAVTAWAGRIWALTVLGSPIFVYKKPVYDPVPL